MCGDNIEPQSQKGDQPSISIGGTADVGGEDSGRIDKLFMSIAAGARKFVEEEQPGHHRIKAAVCRQAHYVRDVYSDWADNMAAIALGVVLMSTKMEANVQEQVHFLYLALSGAYLQPHR